MQDLSNDHDAFNFLSISRIYLLMTVEHNFFKVTNCQYIDNKIDDVSKSASEICPDNRIGRRRNLSRYTIVILSYDTIKGPDERRRFRHGSTKYRCY